MFGQDNSQQQQDDSQSVNPAAPPEGVALPGNNGGNGGFITPTNTDNSQTPPPEPSSAPAAPVSGDDGDLLHIKQEALQQLSPLVGHLEQSPEEKFRTTMMMIQASDDQSLLKTAYEAAKQIGDDTVRAQALLDIVNEINYFTQQHQN